MNTFKTIVKFAFFYVLLLFSIYASARVRPKPKVVKAVAWGIVPNSHENIVPLVKRMLSFYKDSTGLIFEFAEGRYDLLCDSVAPEHTGFEFIGMHNVVFNGKGASFVFHGKMKPFLINRCTNVTLKNFSIDWERPFISQGEIVRVTDQYLDLKIDPLAYPYRFEHDTLTFYGEDWKSRLTSGFTNLHILFDKDKHEVVYRTRDNPLGDIFFGKAREIEHGLIRFYGRPAYKAAPGTLVALFHCRYLSPGIQISNCKDTQLEHVTIYHALSHGILAERSENITLTHTNIAVNQTKGRVFSNIADATHFTNCKGIIRLDSCTHTGMGDDFINVQGVYTKILKRINDTTLVAGTNGRYGLKLAGAYDELFFVDSNTMQRSSHTAVIKRVERIFTGSAAPLFHIITTSRIPEIIGQGYFLENKTWAPSVVITHCQVLRKHRARGILVTTPGKVLIEHNYFSTAGAAILIEGDLNYWFESGANRNVLIRNNVFEDCLTSGPEWGEAVITITPSAKPKNELLVPYHHNIRILGNVFRQFDKALLYARSVAGLKVKNNKISLSHAFVPFSKNPCFFFDACTNVVISSNHIDTDFFKQDVFFTRMKSPN